MPINTGLWTVWGTGTQDQSGGLLHQSPTGALGQYIGVVSNSTYDFTNKTAIAQIDQLPSQVSGVQCYLALEIDSQNKFVIGFDTSVLFGQNWIAGSTDTVFAVAWPAGTRGLKIVVDNAQNLVWYASSLDGATWTTRGSRAIPFATTALKVTLATGCYSTVASPGTARWESVGLPVVVFKNLSGASQGQATASAILSTRATDAYGMAVQAHPNLVAYWRLDESSGTDVREDRGQYPGVYVGAPTLGVPGTNPGTGSRKAASFNGTDQYISTTDVPISGAFSVEAWVKPGAWVAAPATTLINRQDVNGYGGFVLDADSQGRFTLNIYEGAGRARFMAEGWLNCSTTLPLDPTKWHHVVATYDGTGGYIVVDGGFDVAGNGAIGSIFNPPGAYVQIGRNVYWGNCWPGVIDEVALYSVALDMATIEDHYAKGYAPPFGGTAAGQATATGAVTKGVRTTPLPLLAISDDFNDGVMGAQWTTLSRPYTGTAGSNLETGGQLRVAAPANSTDQKAIHGYISTATYDMTGKAVQVEIIQRNTVAAQWSVLRLEIDATRFIEVGCYDVNNNIVAWDGGPGGGSYSTSQQWPVSARFIRIECDADTKNVYIEYSLTGQPGSWVAFSSFSVGRPWPLYDITALKVVLGSGTFVSTPSPGTTIFDSLNVKVRNLSGAATGTSTAAAPTILRKRGLFATSAGKASVGAGGGPPYDQAVLTDAPYAYWRLSEPSGTAAADTSGNGRAGEYDFTGGVAFNQAGAVSGANTAIRTFSGQGYMIVDNALVPYSIFQSDFTIEAWVKPDGSNIDIITKQATLSGNGFRWQFSTAAIQFGQRADGTFVNTNGNTGLIPGVWNHIVVTKVGTFVAHYLNGAPNGGSAILGSATNYATSEPFTLGYNYSLDVGGGAWYDEVAVYNAALSAARISEHYAARSALPGAIINARRVLQASAAGVAIAKASFGLSGKPAGVATASGQVTARRSLARTIAGVSTATGAITSLRRLVAASVGTSTVSAALRALRALAGASAGTTTVNVSFGVPTDEYGAAVYNHPNLVAYWRLGERSGTVARDSSRTGGHHATYVGSPTLGQPSALSDGADASPSFDGVDDYVEIPDFAPGAAGAAEAWFKADTWTGNSCLINRRTTPGNVGGFSLEIVSTGQPYFHVHNGTTWQSIGGTRTLATGVWHHLVGVWAPGGSLLMVNGEDCGRATFAGSMNNPAGPLFRIGHNIPSAALHPDGQIDEVALYSTNVADQTFRDHYRLGVKARDLYQRTVQETSGIVAHWSLNEATRGNAFDQTGNGHNLAHGTGITTTAPAQGITGAPYRSMLFDGTPNAKATRPIIDPLLNFGAAPFTVELWTYQDVLAYGPLIEWGDVTQWGFHAWKYPPGNEANLWVNFGPGIPAGIDTGAYMTAGAWHHVVVLRTGNTGRAYIDGVQRGPDFNLTGYSIGSNFPFNVGYRPMTAPGVGSSGYIDQVALYNRALTPAEIATHYAIGRTPTLSGSAAGTSTAVARAPKTLPLMIFSDDFEDNYISPDKWRIWASGTTAEESARPWAVRP